MVTEFTMSNLFRPDENFWGLPRRTNVLKNKFCYLFFHLKIFPLLMPDLRFDHHFLDMALKSVGWDLLLANLSGSGSLVYQAGEMQVHPDGNRIKDVKMKWSACHERGTKKKSDSPTGFEPITFQTPGGRSIYLSYGEATLIEIGVWSRSPWVLPSSSR